MILLSQSLLDLMLRILLWRMIWNLLKMRLLNLNLLKKKLNQGSDS